MADSRTKKSLINSITSLIFFGINIPISFIGRRYIFQYIGPEVLGMEGVISNILSMVGLAELGIVSSILFTLYKPIINRDTKKISEILSIQGILYSYVAILIVSVSLIISLFFPIFFRDSSFPIYYPYIILISLLTNISLSYMLNYRMIVLNADQKGYKYSVPMLIFGYIKIATQWLILIYSEDQYKYPLYVLVDLTLNIISCIMIDIVIRREYPWLKIEKNKGLIFIRRNMIIVKKTMQIAFHKLAGTIISQTGSIFISMFVSLSMVGIYGNYTLLSYSLNRVVASAFSSISGGIGTLIAEGDNKKVESLYWEYFALAVFISSIAIFGLLSYISDIIRFWIVNSSEVDIILPQRTVFIMSIFYFMLMVRVVDNFIAGYGLFSDIWAPMVEGSIMVISTIILGRLFGLNGVIFSGIISHFFIIILWKQYFLFKNGIKSSVSKMYASYSKYWLIAWGTILTMYFMFSKFFNHDKSTIFNLIKTMTIETSIFVVVLFVVFFLFSKGFRTFLLRMKSFLFKNR